MGQVEEGVASFDKLPQDAADVQILPHMPNPLVSCRTIVRKGHKIILDDPIATVINKKTNEVVMEAVFDDQTSTWNIYPDGPVPYEFKKKKGSRFTWSRRSTTRIRRICHPSCQQCILIDNKEQNC